MGCAAGAAEPELLEGHDDAWVRCVSCVCVPRLCLCCASGWVLTRSTGSRGPSRRRRWTRTCRTGTRTRSASTRCPRRSSAGEVLLAFQHFPPPFSLLSSLSSLYPHARPPLLRCRAVPCSARPGPVIVAALSKHSLVRSPQKVYRIDIPPPAFLVSLSVQSPRSGPHSPFLIPHSALLFPSLRPCLSCVRSRSPVVSCPVTVRAPKRPSVRAAGLYGPRGADVARRTSHIVAYHSMYKVQVQASLLPGPVVVVVVDISMYYLYEYSLWRCCAT